MAFTTSLGTWYRRSKSRSPGKKLKLTELVPRIVLTTVSMGTPDATSLMIVSFVSGAELLGASPWATASEADKANIEAIRYACCSTLPSDWDASRYHIMT